MNSASSPIIYDCDPGRDDAIALIMAVKHPDIDLLGVTTIGGNQTLGHVTRNALNILHALHATDIPVFAGCTKPLLRPVQTAPEIHGQTGLDGIVLDPSPNQVQPLHAVDFIIDKVMTSQPDTITVVATGPLTNLALAVSKEPEISSRVKQVVLMGGAVKGGNVTAAAEFNIHTDPEAAEIVFRSSWPVVMIGLDTTHQATCPEHIQKQLIESGSTAGRLAGEIIATYRQAYHDRYHWPDPPRHDPCAIAYVIAPELFQSYRAPVRVELQGRHTTGMTVVDHRPVVAPDSNTKVTSQVNSAGLWEILINCVKP